MNETKKPREEKKTGKKRAPELKAELYKEIKNIVIEKENKNFNISNKVKELQELLVTNKKNKVHIIEKTFNFQDLLFKWKKIEGDR